MLGINNFLGCEKRQFLRDILEVKAEGKNIGINSKNAKILQKKL